MITAWRFARPAGIILVCLGSLQMAYATGKNPHKKKVQPQLPALPSGPTGPLQQIPLDAMAPVAPQITYERGQLTIVAANSSLQDILSAVRKQTGAQIEVPDARELVVTHLGPGPAKEIIAKLLNGSRFNYVLLSSAQDPSVLTRVLLVARSSEAANAAVPSQPTTPVDVQASSDHPAAAKAAVANSAAASASNNVSDGSNGDQGSTTPEQSGMTAADLQALMEKNERQHLQQQSRAQPVSEPAFSVPEINGATGWDALALLASAILIIRGRREV